MGLPIMRYDGDQFSSYKDLYIYYKDATKRYQNQRYKEISEAQAKKENAPLFAPVSDEYKGSLGGILYKDKINKYAKEFGLDPNFFAAFIIQESSFNPKAIGKDDKGDKSSYGLAQIHESNLEKYGITDKFDPDQSLKAGAQIFSEELKKSDGDYIQALAAYNAGRGNVNLWLYGVYDKKNNPRSAKSKYGVPNFPTTTEYIEKVLDNYNQLTGSDYKYEYEELSAKIKNKDDNKK